MLKQQEVTPKPQESANTKLLFDSQLYRNMVPYYKNYNIRTVTQKCIADQPIYYFGNNYNTIDAQTNARPLGSPNALRPTYQLDQILNSNRKPVVENSNYEPNYLLQI